MDIREVGKAEPVSVEEAAEPKMNMRQGRHVGFTGQPANRHKHDHAVAQSNHMLRDVNSTHTFGSTPGPGKPPA